MPNIQKSFSECLYNKLKDNYPFHPELLNIFQAKWTDLNKFQKTRGLLRILASAMSSASTYDDSSLISAKSFLSNDNQLSSGIMNMLEILDEENWRNILISELEKAKECQINYPGLKNREIEQAVISTFLHSQPKGKSANNADLFSMILIPQIDITSFKQGLEKWKEISWYLKEDIKVWQLTTTPNLTNMHAKAMEGIDSNRINRELSDLVNKVKAISECPRDVKLHKMPNSPKDVPDDGVMKYIIFEPNLACSGNFIPEEIKEFFFSKSGESSSRVYKNALIGLTTDSSKLTNLQSMIKKK